MSTLYHHPQSRELTTNLLVTFSRICFSFSAIDSPFLFLILFFSKRLQAYIFPVARTWHAHTCQLQFPFSVYLSCMLRYDLSMSGQHTFTFMGCRRESFMRMSEWAVWGAFITLEICCFTFSKGYSQKTVQYTWSIPHSPSLMSHLSTRKSRESSTAYSPPITHQCHGLPNVSDFVSWPPNPLFHEGLFIYLCEVL